MGPPGTRSRLTILVWPTRAHSVRIWRTVASFATSDTCPFFMVSCTSAEAVETARSQAVTPMRAVFMVLSILLLPEVVDDLRQDLVKLVLRLVPDESLDAREVRHPARHVLEPRLVRLVVGHELDGGIRTAELFHALGQLLNRDLVLVADVDHLADRLRFDDQLQQRADDVGDMGEGALLRPSPNTVIGSPASACRTKFGMTI